jgi:hypothetical protein
MTKARNIADLGSNDVIETSATGVDVTGTVTADGLAIDNSGDAITITNGDGLTQLGKLKGDATNGFVIEGKVNNNLTLKTKANTLGEGIKFVDTSDNNLMFIDGTTGDVSFYEDTGTTAKMVWDASAERLGIGTASPTVKLELQENTNSTDVKLRLRGFNSSSAGRSAYVAYDPDSRIMGFGEDGNELNIDASGNVGIGTDSPSEKLHVRALTSPEVLVQAITANSANSGRFVAREAGALGYGAGFRYDGDVNTASLFGIATDVETDVMTWSRTGATIQFKTVGSERARINSSGQLLVSTTTGVATGSISNAQIETVAKANENCIATQVVTNAYTAYASSGITSTGGDHHLYGYMVNGSGSNVGSIRVNHNGVVYNTTSDRRLKENIQDTTHTVDINDIQVRQFDWKDGGNHERYGFIAQELETVYPEAVTRPDNDDEMMSVDYSKLVPLLVKEIQQLKAEIKELKA